MRDNSGKAKCTSPNDMSPLVREEMTEVKQPGSGDNHRGTSGFRGFREFFHSLLSDNYLQRLI